MSKKERDELAKQILLVSLPALLEARWKGSPGTNDMIAESAVSLADAMMARLSEYNLTETDQG